MSSFIFNIGIIIGNWTYRFALKRKNCKIDIAWKKIFWRFYASRLYYVEISERNLVSDIQPTEFDTMFKSAFNAVMKNLKEEIQEGKK